jgi:hypothetical protein
MSTALIARRLRGKRVNDYIKALLSRLAQLCPGRETYSFVGGNSNKVSGLAAAYGPNPPCLYLSYFEGPESGEDYPVTFRQHLLNAV